MVFSSAIFVFQFLAILLFVYYIVDVRYRNLVLLCASILFYAWGEPKYVILMLASILVNYCLGIFIEIKPRWGKPCLVLTVVYNIGVLFIFKYFNFSVDFFSKLTGVSITVPQIALPIGISFFTFQIMSYVIDVYRGKVRAQRNVLNLALYISLFPQLIAGPIVRYVDVEKQIAVRQTSWEKFYEGTIRFCIGFSKKVLIADQLDSLVKIVFEGSYPSLLGNWVGIIAYALQIYFDFSGYSDMAIGMGKMFGFDFLENFNYPYVSKSIKEFWRRWHISLSGWFRDYLYIPLGGSRNGTAKTYINLLIVFLLTGLWHGASFTFIAWGLFHGLFLIIERIGFHKMLEKTPSIVQRLYTILIVLIGWVFFRADGLKAAMIYIRGMFIPYGHDLINLRFLMNTKDVFCIIAGIIFCIPHRKAMEKLKSGSIFSVCILMLLILALCYMVGSGYSPFLYFRF